MSNTLIIGPLAIPYALLLVFAVAAASLFAGTLSARKTGTTVESELWATLIFGLVIGLVLSSLFVIVRKIVRDALR